MDNILTKINNIHQISELLTINDNQIFISDNKENIDAICDILLRMEKSLELYEIPEEKILKFNLDEKITFNITKILFPIYWNLYLQSNHQTN